MPAVDAKAAAAGASGNGAVAATGSRWGGINRLFSKKVPKSATPPP
eukprot:CAMPEP_0183311994 /NCGR_PEP_ID=MMETSP0160_2-20130417/39812_1 /TAXON_ID=2839 ORGANISM="Odontella Sinensis, Strain Grunow 1884" /NCGR_SAMPLE_ID=MMETSP0160_2 /ASSEMBLY_ACC=CAM_ASM_000250 /LENGTH=45 /DNA_ID= /DNA_START= /DNA_END= /DNA_ORIENTATION=